MDYETKPTSRKRLRYFAKLFRKIFRVGEWEPINVLQILEVVPIIFKNTSISIVNDWELPANVPARCTIANGKFQIEIKETVYNGAYKKKIGAYCGFIMHEICHVFLYKLGFTPVMNRSFDNDVLPAYCSVEWQAKALCGEIMMPYEVTGNMPIFTLMRKFNVSKGFAEMRQRY